MATTIRVDVPWGMRNVAPSCNGVDMTRLSCVQTGPTLSTQETTWQCVHCKTKLLATAIATTKE